MFGHIALYKHDMCDIHTCSQSKRIILTSLTTHYPHRPSNHTFEI